MVERLKNYMISKTSYGKIAVSLRKDQADFTF